MSYPNNPGYKNETTSKESAKKVESRAHALRILVLEIVRNSVFGVTPDRCAAILDESILSIRPRFTELKNKGLIKDSGRRGKTECGKNSIVWISA